jgi:hypothetical protein
MKKSWRWYSEIMLVVMGSPKSRTVVQASLGKEQESTSRITKVKRAGDMAQAVECLPIKCEALPK